ncbi:MAG: 4-hydroxythreonine-4-phosphate dehydrogenase PdxA [Phycisphaerales bacterium]|nr:4-hydroxythreonine-4-phosphate dehydrogenase PdxA [Phycisphaerales bacterium]
MGVDRANQRPVLAISMGDPSGIGPEVTVRALADRALRSRARCVVFGSIKPWQAAAEACGIEPYWWQCADQEALVEAAHVQDVVVVDVAPDAPGPGSAREATKAAGSASFQYVERAIEHVRTGKANALVTAPINKAAWALAGHGRYAGHTELLASRFRSKRTRMAFVAPQLRVMLATAHVPLMHVSESLTIGRVFETIELGAELCAQLGIASPRIAVCGLNPHAGEGGMLGEEDGRVIQPAIRLAQEQGVDAKGPFPADTVFNAALEAPGRPAPQFDLVIAMYHDQGLIPVKLLAFDSAVNVTVGLGAIRTSPDHGTAFDLAGRGVANAGSMLAAIELAIRLASARADEGVSCPRATTSADRPGK